MREALVVCRLEDAKRERVRAQIAERVQSFAGVDGIELPAVSVVASGS